MVAVLFVCLGNICRSPAAEEVLRHLAKADGLDLHVESCGIGDWHVGCLPDERMRDAAKARGLILSSRGQQFKSAFLEKFDYILAADKEVIRDLYFYAQTPEHKAKIHMMTAFSPCYRDKEIPDPYYQGDFAFEHVLDMLEDSCQGLIEHIKKS